MIKKSNITIPELSGDAGRRLYVSLPAGYEKNKTKRYPVLYMFDGHNVFFDSDATYGKSWGMGRYLSAAQKELIVVAVECNHKGNGRLMEYSPFSFENGGVGKIRGRGRAYMRWLTEVLKPRIDATYRTLPDRAHTAIAGSSMGGLMALYGGCAYNHVFSMAACLSPSLWVAPDKVLEMIGKANIRSDTCIYMDYGSEEMGNHAENHMALTAAAQVLLAKGAKLTFRIVPGGSHCEASWEQQIPIFMACLGL